MPTTHNIGLFYGTNSGATEEAAEYLAKKAADFGVGLTPQNIIEPNSLEKMLTYDYLILGIPTWNFGEYQDDWEDFVDDLPSDSIFQGKTVALFGLGDQDAFADWFLDAMGMLAEELIQRGATLIGRWSIEGYEHDASKAILEEGWFCGLALDDDGQPELTEGRIDQWLSEILPQITEG